MAVSREVDEFAEVDALDARPAQATSNNPITSGWGAAETALSTEGFPEDFKFSDNGYQVVKFLDEDGPFAVYRQHFLDQKSSGRKSYISLGPNDPLCTKLGSKPEEKTAFSIVNLSAPGGPQRQMLKASPRFYKALHAAHFSPQGPLTRNYWALSRTGKMQTTAYHVNPVKERDLLEDWGIDAEAAAAAVAKAKPFTREDLKYPTWEELEEVANAIINGN